MITLDLIPKMSQTDFDKCEFCSQAKITKKPHKSVDRFSEPLDLIHSDICELDGTLTRHGHRYFITFIDDCSDFTYVYLMKNKSDAFDMFKSFKTEIENIFYNNGIKESTIIGLSLVKKIINNGGGDIKLQSEFEKYTVFL